MRVSELNEEIRDYITNLQEVFEYPSEPLEKINSIVKLNRLYKYIKEKNETSKYLAGLLFSTSYAVNNNLKLMGLSDEELDDRIIKYDSFLSIDELIDNLNMDTFKNMCSDALYFEDLNSYSKRSLIRKVVNKNKYLLNIFPCFLLDFIGFLHVYEASEVMEDYYTRLPNYEDADEALEDSVNFGVSFLIDLEDLSFSNYCSVILDMIEIYYKYTCYLNSKDAENFEETECIILDIESDLNSFIHFCVDNNELLRTIVETYIKYSTLDRKEVKKIDDYYGDGPKRKKLLRISKNCQKIKKDEDYF